jgi:FkbM family methyltransferase
MDRAGVAYAMRRAIRYPRVAYIKRRLPPGPVPAVCEHFSYSKALFQLREAVLAKPDLLIDFGLDENSVVVEGGAYVGNWAERVASSYGSRVYTFEPNPNALKKLHVRAAQYPSITVLEYGLGARNETLSLTMQGPGSSLYNDHFFTRKTKTEVTTTTVPIRDVVEVFDELGLEHLDLLALNIEGSEFDVLPRLADTGWLPRIDSFLVQFHEWLPRSHRRRRAIQRQLRETHTQLFDFPWIWEAWQRSDIAR